MLTSISSQLFQAMTEDVRKVPWEDGNLHHPVQGAAGSIFGWGRVEVSLGDLSQDFDFGANESYGEDKALIKSIV